MDRYRQPFPFHTFRALRQPTGRPICPHCGARHVQSWGSFSGRRRYRCVPCGRTFSDFTRTPLAHLKRIDRWPTFCRCAAESRTVRDTGRILGVHKDTAFRWRHRLLRWLDQCDQGPLAFRIFIDETWFPYSRKGERGLRPRATRHGDLSLHVRGPRERAWVVVARDGTGRTVARVVSQQRPRAGDIERHLGDRLRLAREIRSPFGSMGAAGIFAARHRRPYRRVRGLDDERVSGRDYILALRRWLRPFRGVATRYLDHYLTWHRLLIATVDNRVGSYRDESDRRQLERCFLTGHFP